MPPRSDRTRRWTPKLAAAAVACVVAGPALLGADGAAAEPIAAAPGPVLPELMNRRTVKAIDAGLKYLARVQHRSGRWLSDGRYGQYPAAMTPLAGLAMMAGGSTPAEGLYAKEVRRAMNFVLNSSQEHEDGLLIGSGGGSRSMYGHGFSMLFLAQCYGMQTDEEKAERISKV
ncbi:MAG: hypothetical protein ACOC8F_06830, partial [Planctomycetota bacterium]